MENLIVSVNVVLPLFLMMALGYFLKAVRLYDDHVLNKMNNLVFKVFLPILLFVDLYSTDLESVFNPTLVLFAGGSVLAAFFLSMAYVCLTEKSNKIRGALIQGIFRSNFLIFGIPIARSIYGDNAASSAAILISIVIPLFNILTVTEMEIFRGGKVKIRSILKGIATNPLILSCAAGFLFLFLRIPIPEIVYGTLTDLSRVATPLALIILGGSIKFSKTMGYFKQIVTGLLGKLVVVPAIFLPIAAAIGFRGQDMAVLISLYCSPVAVSSFVMAQQMDSDGDLAGQFVVLGAALSVVTIFLWVFLFKNLGLL